MNIVIHTSVCPLVVPLCALSIAWFLDKWLGDPQWFPHPVVGFGKLIAAGERRLNRGRNRLAKGGLWAVILILSVYWGTWAAGQLCLWAGLPAVLLFQTFCIFSCLAGTTLMREVKQVFEAADRSIGEGRARVSRIVGRDTSELSAQEIRAAALETLSENLSDGVIAPLFWYALLGVPGMMAYKMVNTLDSMVGYRNERYGLFGRVAARIDDAANFLPARLTALLMVLSAGRPSLFRFVKRYGRAHSSPNSGFPEAALAGILDCRFGGPHRYFGEIVHKPYIGTNERMLTTDDLNVALSVNRRSEYIMTGCIIIGHIGNIALYVGA